MIDRERHIDLRDIDITHDPAVINAEKGFVFFPLLIRHDEARVTLLAQLRIICAGVLEHLLIISIINLRNLIRITRDCSRLVEAVPPIRKGRIHQKPDSCQ